jgi:hypothetical protein
MLVEGFSIFGMQVQYWMLLAVLIAAFVVIAGATEVSQRRQPDAPLPGRKVRRA